MGGGLEAFDDIDGRVEDRAEEEEARDQHGEHGGGLDLAAKPLVEQDRQPDHRRADEKREEDAEGAVPGPDRQHGRGGDQDRRQPAKRHEADDADVEEAGIAPLHVHAEREDGRDQPHVEDAERGVPARRQALADDEGGHEGEKKDVAHVHAHTDFPLKRPVGLKSRTMIRIAKETANL